MAWRIPVSGTILSIVFVLVFFYFSPAQISVNPIISAGQQLPSKVDKLDSILTKYYRESIKIYLDEIGEFRLTSRNLVYSREMYDRRLQLQYEQSLSWVRQEFTAKLDFKLKKNWYIRGEMERKVLNSRSGIFLFFKKEYE